MKIMVTSLYNGQVNRGAEAWTYQFFKSMTHYQQDVILIQGGEVVSDSVSHLEGIQILRTPAKDLSGDKSILGKIKKRLNLHPSQTLVKKFSRKCLPALIRENPDFLLPSNGCLKLFRRAIQKYKLKTKIFFVGHAGPVSDLNFADVFFALSQRDALKAMNLFPNLKTFSVPNGFDPEIFNSEKVYQRNSEEFSSFSRPIILCVSALVAYKRVDSVIRAVARIPNASLLIAGSGPEKMRLIEIIKQSVIPGRRKNFVFLEQTDLKKMPKYYASSDVFVHAARESEAFGNVIVEALSMGNPVVVNDDPVRREIVGEHGVLVNPENSEQFAQAIQQAFLEMNEESKKERILFAQKYRWDNIGKIYINYLQSVKK